MNSLPKKVSTTVSLERVLLEAARERASQEGFSLSAFLEAIVIEQLSKRNVAAPCSKRAGIGAGDARLED